MFTINAKRRDQGIDLDVIRKEGELPAVFYGTGKASTSITIPTAAFKKLWREAGESSTIKISLEKDNVDALIHEVQVHPVTSEPIHVDFLVVDMNKKIKVKVPLEFEGISDAVKNGLGNLVKVLFEIEIEALPKDLPHDIAVDISKLKTLENNIVVSDIKLPNGVVAITGANEVVASIVAQVEEKEEVVAPVDLSAIEVEKKGKKEEEGETKSAEGGSPDASTEASREKSEKK